MELSTYLISTAITWHKIVAAIAVIVIIAAAVIYFRSRSKRTA